MAQDDIQGTVTDSAGDPVENAVVALIPNDGSNGDDVLYTTTDSNGDYIFDGHPQGDGTTQEWHVMARFDDGSGEFNTLSLPYVSADLPEQAPIPDSVTNQWKMNEGSGTTLTDSVGTQDATLNGGGWESNANSVGGFRTTYDGVDDSSVTDAQFGINGAEITALGWVTTSNPSRSDSQLILSSTESNNGWRIDIASSAARFGHRSDNFTSISLDDGGSLTADKRYMVAQAISGDSADCYLFDNSGLIDSGSLSGARETGFDSALYFGSRAEDNDFNLDGTLDAPALAVGTQMSQSEIEDYHTATSP